jgi:hypothetical protein
LSLDSEDLNKNKDNQKGNQKEKKIAELKKYCLRYPDLCFIVYASQGGLHLFEASKRWDHRSDAAMRLMLEFQSDFYYIIYSHIRGWSVRLNQKNNEYQRNVQKDILADSDDSTDRKELYQYIGTFGTGTVNDHCYRLIQLHLSLSKIFIDASPSQMFGGVNK